MFSRPILGRARLQHVARDDRAHQRELQQMLRRATDVRAEVEHVGRALDAGDRRDDRGPVDAGQRLQDVARRRHQCAGVAGAHAGIGFAALHELDRDAQRRVFLLLQRARRRLVHRDDFGRVLEAEPRAVAVLRLALRLLRELRATRRARGSRNRLSRESRAPREPRLPGRGRHPSRPRQS